MKNNLVPSFQTSNRADFEFYELVSSAQSALLSLPLSTSKVVRKSVSADYGQQHSRLLVEGLFLWQLSYHHFRLPFRSGFKYTVKMKYTCLCGHVIVTSTPTTRSGADTLMSHVVSVHKITPGKYNQREWYRTK